MIRWDRVQSIIITKMEEMGEMAVVRPRSVPRWTKPKSGRQETGNRKQENQIASTRSISSTRGCELSRLLQPSDADAMHGDFPIPGWLPGIDAASAYNPRVFTLRRIMSNPQP
jgi:hypothetical protein